MPRTSNFTPNFLDSSMGGEGSSYQVMTRGRNSNGWREEKVSVEASTNKIKIKKQTNLSVFAVPITSNFIPDFADSSMGGGGSSYQVATSGRNSNGQRKEEVSVEASKSKIKTK